MSDKLECLRALLLDWAGTTIDHGSRAPAMVFQEVFRQRGVPITAAQARAPMGMAKRDHIATIAAMPEVSQKWQSVFGRVCDDADIDKMYEEFLPLQKETLRSHCDMIPGVVDAVATLRAAGLRIGSSTGYTRELMTVVKAEAARHGYAPDVTLCAEDTPRGRPAPYLLWSAAMQLDVYPMWKTVAVDDTPVGVEAGRNAGCWTIGITRTGNCLGLSLEEVNALPAEELRRLCDDAARKLKDAGADYILESVADIVPVMQEIDQRAARGERPR